MAGWCEACAGIGSPVAVLASAGFETEPGSQQALLGRMPRPGRQRQSRPAARPGPEHQVPAILTGAAVTIFPSALETFGNLALESLSAGTPVAAYATGTCPRSWTAPQQES
jgi:glycosyltransferase involved in cell wall biosynthesis